MIAQSGQMFAGGDAKSDQDSKRQAIPREMEVSSKEKEEDYEAQLDDEYGLFQQVRSGHHSELTIAAGKSSHHSCKKN